MEPKLCVFIRRGPAKFFETEFAVPIFVLSLKLFLSLGDLFGTRAIPLFFVPRLVLVGLGLAFHRLVPLLFQPCLKLCAEPCNHSVVSALIRDILKLPRIGL